MCIDKLLINAKEAEENDVAEDAYFYHTLLSLKYKKIGNIVKSKLHKAKAAVYNDEEEIGKMRFLR